LGVNGDIAMLLELLECQPIKGRGLILTEQRNKEGIVWFFFELEFEDVVEVAFE
jgi:hypothetical protein